MPCWVARQVLAEPPRLGAENSCTPLENKSVKVSEKDGKPNRYYGSRTSTQRSTGVSPPPEPQVFQGKHGDKSHEFRTTRGSAVRVGPVGHKPTRPTPLSDQRFCLVQRTVRRVILIRADGAGGRRPGTAARGTPRLPSLAQGPGSARIHLSETRVFLRSLLSGVESLRDAL
jgi:hypothetical protein